MQSNKIVHDTDHDDDQDEQDEDDTCMCPYVGGEVVWPTELSEADPTLEGLLAWEHWICLFIFSCNLFKSIAKFIINKCVSSTVFRSTCVYPYVSRQFVASRESAVTLVHWASVRPLVHLGRIWTCQKSNNMKMGLNQGDAFAFVLKTESDLSNN